MFACLVFAESRTISNAFFLVPRPTTLARHWNKSLTAKSCFYPFHTFCYHFLNNSMHKLLAFLPSEPWSIIVITHIFTRGSSGEMRSREQRLKNPYLYRVSSSFKIFATRKNKTTGRKSTQIFWIFIYGTHFSYYFLPKTIEK